MKKTFFAVFVLLGMLVATTGAAFAGSAIELKTVRNDSAGPTFIFRVSGTFTSDELNTFVKVQGGDNVPLYCRQIEADTAICHAAKTIGGKNVIVYFGGAKFWTKVPEQSVCYNVYDWPAPSSLSSDWKKIARHCQDGQAEIEEQISVYNPDYDSVYNFDYFPAGLDCSLPTNNQGKGYYYVCFLP